MVELNLYEKLHKECDVRLPYPDEQDWEFCTGDYKRTNDYISFYNRHSSDMSHFKKELLVNMIIQGIEDYLEYSGEQENLEYLWNETKRLLIKDKHKHSIIYWSCIGEDLVDCWNITQKMRELLVLSDNF